MRELLALGGLRRRFMIYKRAPTRLPWSHALSEET